MHAFSNAVPRLFVIRIALTASLALIANLLLGPTTVLHSADWPTLRHDQRRSGVTEESLNVARFRESWSWQSPLPPAPAWPDSARWDAYAKLSGLRSMRDYDPVFHPIASEESVYFASNADDTVRCLRLNNGALEWTFTADAPVRVAPTLSKGTLYFGSDDGCVYALDAKTGELRWKTELVPGSGCFVNDGRLCSRQPVRTGVVIDEEQGVAIAGCGIFPWKSTSLKALDLNDGSIAWESDLGTGWTLEGGMLLSNEHIIAPQGRSPPQLFDRSTGKSKGAVSGGGGSFVLLTEDQELMHGPGNKQGWITTSSTENRQKIASFEGGSSVVVVGRIAFLLTPQHLTAVDRDSQQPVWKVKLDRPQEIIATQGHVLVGGDGYVMAVSQESGELQWLQPVGGKAVGIAVAGSSIITSTDRGEVTVFAESSAAEGAAIDESVVDLVGYESLQIDVELAASGEPEPPKSLDVESRVFHWAFQSHRTTASGKQSIALESLIEGAAALTLPESSRFVQVGADHALVLDDVTQATVVKDYNEANLPTQDFTIQATVRLDRTQAWGGFLSAMQDNGSYEKGWILGFQGDKFGVAVNGKEGPDRLTWVTAKEAVQPERWYHLAATYDGQELKLFVNGQLIGFSKEQRGTIEYPDSAGVEFGAYKDKDEFFPTYGRINEVALLKRALSEEEVQAHFQSRQEVLGAGKFQQRAKAPVETDPKLERDPNAYEIAIGPELQFVRPGTARVSWITSEPTDCEIEIISGRGEAKRVESESTAEIHLWEIAGLGRNELVEFQIRTADGQLSRIYECDSHFDYSRPALPALESNQSMRLAASVRELLPTDQSRGIALVLDDSNAELAEALAVQSGYDVIALSAADGVSVARQRLLESGTYGRPVSVIENERLNRFPYDFANFIVCPASESDDDAPQDAWEWANAMERLVSVLKPGGYFVSPAGQLPSSQAEALGLKLVERSADVEGTSYAVWQRNRAPGAASWTHMYGQPDNGAYSGEALREADSVDDLELTWCGRPGPRYQSDRGNRKPSPLAAGGRLYLQGLYRLIALDAHNGTILWNHELPEVVRFNVPRDCSNWCADDEAVYLSIQNRCRVINGATGETIVDHPVYNPTDREMNWGFVARHEDLLLGSCVQAGSHFDGFWGGEHWYDSKDGELAKKVCSDALFAQEPVSGERKWTYKGGLIVNPTISVGKDRIFFVECRSKELMAAKTRRLDGEAFWRDQWVVALDVHTGEKLWEQRAKPIPGVTAFYGVLSKDRYLIQSSNGGEFALYSMDVANGKMEWRGKYKWEVDHHGKHLSRPAIIGQKVFLRPFTIDLGSGKVLADKFPTGHQCGTYTASKNALFLRAGSLTMWDGKSTAATRWNRVRPDCWISTIPAEGMLLSPEGGGGCSCGGWIETSMAFSPKPQMNAVSEPSSQGR